MEVYEGLAGQPCSGEDVARLADEGDPGARGAFAEFGQALGHALCWLINTLDPQAVALGGSIARSAPHFEPAMRAAILAGTVSGPQVHVYASQLGEAAGIAGAARLHWLSQAHDPVEAARQERAS